MSSDAPSVVFYKKNWTNESKKQLEIAMNMDPYNTKYKEAYTKLKQKMEFNEKAFHSAFRERKLVAFHSRFRKHASPNMINAD